MEENQLSVEQLASLAAGNAAPGVGDAGSQAPAAYGGIEIPVFTKALEEASGGAFKSVEELRNAQSALQAVQQIPTLQQKIQDYEAKAAISPWANPLVEKLNQVFKDHDPATAKLYADLAFTDLQTLDSMQAIRMQMRLDYPGMSPENIDALIYDKVGITDDMDHSSLPTAQVAKLEAEKQMAIKSLTEKKVSYETAQATPEDPRIQQQRDMIVDGWANKVIPAFDSKVDISLPAEANRPAYAFGFIPAPETIQAVDAQVMQIIKGSPENYPLTREGLANVQTLRQNLLLIADRENFTKALVSDVYASAMEYAVKKTAGPTPTPPVPLAQPAPTKPGNTRNVGQLVNAHLQGKN